VNAALFDIDGTLLKGPHSSEALFIRHLLRHGVIGPRQAASAAWFTLANGPRYGRHVFRKNKAYLAGLALDDVAAIARDFVVRDLETLIDDALLRRMDEHRSGGDTILLLTGTPAFLAKPLSERVGADGCQAARYALRDGRFAAAAPVSHPLGEDKVAAAAALCARYGTDLAEAWAYADSIHDLSLLTRVGRPVAVRPDRRLAGEARARGWEIIGPSGGGGHGAATGRTRPA
jgi:HAD superfamily hydrolase (TIGR01490 family)